MDICGLNAPEYAAFIQHQTARFYCIPRDPTIHRRHLTRPNHARGASSAIFLSASPKSPALYYNISNMWKPIVLLCASNLFMTAAWYGHLKFKNSALWLVIVTSWAIAFFEYCLQVPANRLGSGYFSVTQLKVMQEVITLVVFAGFSAVYFKESLKWNHLVGFMFLVAAVFFVFKKW